MMCQVCGKKEATVLYTHVAGNQKKSVHMCADCVAAHKVKLQGAVETAKTSVPKSPVAKKSEVAAEAGGEGRCCSHCGTTYEDFRERGRFGCSRCYESFAGELERLLKRIHGSLDHCGKGIVPRRVTNSGGSELEDLTQALARAVAAEAYEQAAELRDRIRTLTVGPAADCGTHTRSGAS